MRTRNQEFAAKVFGQVTQVAGRLGREESKRYASLTQKLPVLVRTAGLAQALAFVDARGGAAGERLLGDLAAVVGLTTAQRLLECAREAELPEYMRLTGTVLEALNWYKRFAQSVPGLKEGVGGEATA